MAKKNTKSEASCFCVFSCLLWPSFDEHYLESAGWQQSLFRVFKFFHPPQVTVLDDITNEPRRDHALPTLEWERELRSVVEASLLRVRQAVMTKVYRLSDGGGCTRLAGEGEFGSGGVEQ